MGRDDDEDAALRRLFDRLAACAVVGDAPDAGLLGAIAACSLLLDDRADVAGAGEPYSRRVLRADDAFAAELPGTLLVDPIVSVAAAIAARHPESASGGSGRGGPARSGPIGDRAYLTTGDPRAMRRAAARAWSVDLATPTRVDL